MPRPFTLFQRDKNKTEAKRKEIARKKKGGVRIEKKTSCKEYAVSASSYTPQYYRLYEMNYSQ